MNFSHKTNFYLALASAIVGALFNYWRHEHLPMAAFAGVFTLFFCWMLNYVFDCLRFLIVAGWTRWTRRKSANPDNNTP